MMPVVTNDVAGYRGGRRAGYYLWVADELPVQLCIKRLHMQAVDIQHWITNNTDLFKTIENSHEIISMIHSPSLEQKAA